MDVDLLGKCNPFSLPLPNHRSLELGHSPKQREKEVGHRRILTGEGEILLEELNVDTLLGEVQNNSPEVIDASGEPVHAVNQQ